MTRPTRWTFRLLLTLPPAALVAALGCSGDRGGGGAEGRTDPLVEMKQKELATHQRADAVDRAWERAEATGGDKAGTREAFKSMLWARNAPGNVRARAAQKLLSDSSPEGEADNRRLFALLLPTETDWSIIELVSVEAAERGWTDLTPALVRSYARPVPQPLDPERPERAALLKLHPGQDITEIVYAVFADTATGEKSEKARRDAWDLLQRLDKDGSARASMLARTDAGAGGGGASGAGAGGRADPAMEQLRGVARELRAVPITGSELGWVKGLREGGDGRNVAWWAQATAALSTLTSDQAAGLEVRHAEPVRWAASNRPEWLRADRAALRGEVKARLDGRKKHRRTADLSDNGAGGIAPRETVDDEDARLVWADLLAILVIDEAVHDPAVRAALFDQAEIDRRDTSTEYGGVLQAGAGATRGGGGGGASAGQFEAVSFPPRPVQRLGDNRFVASDDMMTAGGRSLAHYHFHVQRTRNADYAGPGPGDLQYAAQHGRNCVVFTSINSETLAADYYQRNGATIDLGEIGAPVGGVGGGGAASRR